MTADLEYTAQSERDYGTLACWAANEVGRQAEPCVFRVVQASEYSRATLSSLQPPLRMLYLFLVLGN